MTFDWGKLLLELLAKAIMLAAKIALPAISDGILTETELPEGSGKALSRLQ